MTGNIGKAEGPPKPCCKVKQVIKFIQGIGQ